MGYDSKNDTLNHIGQVNNYLRLFRKHLEIRGKNHDKSKLENPEKEVFDKFVPMLQTVQFGTKEYKAITSQMKIGTSHHNSKNRHHPEHFENGIKGMNLVDLVEMFCDWKAATLRNPNGDLVKSIGILKERFGFSDDLEAILLNSVEIVENFFPCPYCGAVPIEYSCVTCPYCYKGDER